ncbi:Plasma membrane proteolipid 3 [Escovopsis weberi]|uniref:Plasma membrane proteolipid 3 n=1 Tax=Escovopsis weberi TaxID=150374 RepID=A0A0M9VUA5_ESCWE|nr:Plasma membrane proteolipid 3 [Escovopsis weberi]
MGVVSAVLLVVLTVLYLFINVCLTILGYIPGHIHAFYIEYVYYDRREQAFEGRVATRYAPGIYSRAVQTGGEGYGTIIPTTE